MDKSNIVEFKAAKKKRDEQKKIEEITHSYQLTIDDARAFFRVLGLIKELSYDGNINIDLKDDDISITKTSLSLIHDYNLDEEDDEESKQITTTQNVSATFEMDWEMFKSDKRDTAEVLGSTALCDSIILLAEFDDFVSEYLSDETDETIE